jgi:hypothetical protein
MTVLLLKIALEDLELCADSSCVDLVGGHGGTKTRPSDRRALGTAETRDATALRVATRGEINAITW